MIWLGKIWKRTRTLITKISPITDNSSPLKVGITGQAGFIGTHLFNYLNLQNNISLLSFKDSYFQSVEKLDNFVSNCDTIIHLAAINRHRNHEFIYKMNIQLVQQLVASLDRTNSRPHIIMFSFSQEERDSPNGRSKKEGRKLLIYWARSNNAKFTELIIPNVFGPFCRPFYNSVISSFSFQLTHNQSPQIQVDAKMNLIYVQDLIKNITDVIGTEKVENELLVPPRATAKVTDILNILEEFHAGYFLKGIFPKLDNYFELCLFNTYRSYIDVEYFPYLLELHSDARGSFVETVKSLNKGQFSYSSTKPGVTRGNHFHINKVERFVVIKGDALIRLRRIGKKKIIEYKLNGDNPAYVDMPVWYTHNITNIGNNELITLFWINEFYDPDDDDTYYEEV